MSDYSETHLEELGEVAPYEDDIEARETESDDDEGESDQDILARAKHRFKVAADAERDIRKDALEDLKFCSGEQWPPEIRYQRDQDKRPCLTVNQLPQFVRQITNDQRQNRPAISIDALDLSLDGSPDDFEELSEIREGMVRDIQRRSSSEIAYDTAFEQAAKGGFGYFRITHDYAAQDSFDQEIFIKRIRNQFSVYLDPAAQEPDGSDASWGHVFDQMTKEEFRAEFPKANLSQMNDWTSVGDNDEDWFQDDGCRISEYFELSYDKAQLLMFENGEAHFEDEIPEDLDQSMRVIDERESNRVTVMRYKINGIEILERTKVPGRFIPIIPVYGDEYMIEGKRKLEGIIRHAKDSQRMINFWKSAETEAIALAPRAPWLMAEGQDEGFTNEWKTANVRNHAVLHYKPKTIGGEVVAPPQRITAEPAIQAITAASQQATVDLRETTGIKDADLGNRSNELSGVAIQRRAHQSQVANFHLPDNFSRSLKHAGRIINDWLGDIYDTPRQFRTIDAEGKQKVVWINRPFQDSDGKTKFFDLKKGKFDVAVDTSPNFATKRQEMTQSMLELSKVIPPQQLAVITDLMVKNMDWAGHEAIAARLQKTLPPGFVEQQGQPDIPPQVQAQMSQMQNLVQQLSGKLAAAEQIINTKMIEVAARERIENAKIKASVEKTLAEMGAASAETLLEHQVAQLQRQEDLLNQSQAGGQPAAPGNQPQPTGGMPGQTPGGIQ